MTTYTELTEKMGGRLLDTLKQIENVSASAAETVAGSAARVLPDLPSVPGADKVPSPTEVVTANFALVERLLEAQKDYVLRLAAVGSSAEAKPRTKARAK